MSRESSQVGSSLLYRHFIAMLVQVSFAITIGTICGEGGGRGDRDGEYM